METIIFSVFNPPAKDGLIFTEEDESLTQQHFAEEADVNNIMRRYAQTGYIVDPLNPGTAKPMFGDFSVDFDYQEAQNMLISANNQFMALPADLRKRFGNNPGELLAFLADSNNKDEAIRLGLIDSPEVPPAPLETPKE